MAKKTEIKQENIEREYIITLRRKINKVPSYKRANKAVKSVQEFIARHMKVYDRDLKKIKIDRYLNEAIWERGIKKPLTKVKVKAIKEGEIVRVELAELPKELKFKKIREERREKEGEEKKTEKKKEEKAEEKPEEKAEEKKVEEEKKASVVEAGKELEKIAGKKIKHESKMDMRQPKHQRRKALQK